STVAGATGSRTLGDASAAAGARRSSSVSSKVRVNFLVRGSSLFWVRRRCQASLIQRIMRVPPGSGVAPAVGLTAAPVRIGPWAPDREGSPRRKEEAGRNRGRNRPTAVVPVLTDRPPAERAGRTWMRNAESMTEVQDAGGCAYDSGKGIAIQV